MNIEIIEFYPIEISADKGDITGTLRIKLPDIGAHILGIFVTKRKNYWHFKMPSRKSIDLKTGEPVQYPIFIFEDKETNRFLMDAIREKGRAFIEKKLRDIENQQNTSQKTQSSYKNPEHLKALENVTASKEIVTIAKSKAAMQEGIDPPKRKQIPRKVKTYGK